MEEQLIAAVYKQKAIWDPADELRKNSKILKTLWTEVSKEVGVDVNLAKNKWKNLRAYFVNQQRELDKPKSGSGGCSKTTSTWPFYNQLLFLKDVVMPSDSAREDSLLSLNKSPDESQTDEMYDDFDPDNFIDSSASKLRTGKETGTDEIPASDMADITIASPSEPGTSRNKPATSRNKPATSTCEGNSGKQNDFTIRRGNTNKRKTNAGSGGFIENKRNEILDIERRKVELLEREMHSEENPDLLFFKSLLPYMKEFSPMQKLRIRSQIQNLILAEHEASQHSSGTFRDFTSSATGMMAQYHQSQYYHSPSPSSVSADSAQYQSSTSSPASQLTYTNLTPINFCDLTQN